ncbi:hypothetical protein L3X38_012219 [Prunus dulcis]|uniref:Retroviral polymerase SH3-like domain-containing protein n=1 Tax=Prunus dulcis TaxID=3755 RepID=A0AAD4WLP8_PRUDU|nr:hypothetical protein L3X38_012219 [Prunus dulcis]
MCLKERTNNCLKFPAHSYWICLFPIIFWGHVVLSATYLINRTPSWVLDFKTPRDVFGDHVSPIFISKLPLKVFGRVAYVHVYSHQQSKLDPCALRCVFISYSSTQKGYKCHYAPNKNVHVTLDMTFHEEMSYYVSPSSPIQGESGSELESFGLEDLGLNDVCEYIADISLREKTTGRPSNSDWSPSLERKMMLTVSKQLVAKMVTIGRGSESDDFALCDKMTDCLEQCDRSPGTVSCDSCED